MADDKTRTDATESDSEDRDADRQISVADRPATNSSTSDADGARPAGNAADAGHPAQNGNAERSEQAGPSGKLGESAANGEASAVAETGSEPGSDAEPGSAEPEAGSGTPSVHSRTGESRSARSARSKVVLGVRRLLKRPAVLVSSLLVLVLAASTAYLGWRVAEQNGADSDRAQQVAAGEKYALALTSYDFKNLQGNFAAVTENSTDRFGKQYKQVSDSLTKLIEQYQATSKGNVVEAGVVSSDEKKAVLSLFVDQSVTNTNSPQPRVDRNRMKMTLVHSVDERGGDRWLLDDVQLV